MGTDDQMKIHFCFPEASSVQNKETLIETAIAPIKYSGKFGYAGLRKREYLHDVVSNFIGNEIELYKPLSQRDRKTIEQVIFETSQKCQSFVDVPNFSVFIFPWLAEFKSFVKKMGGVNGFAPYKKAIHLYITPGTYNKSHIAQTLAHEINHIVFYENHGFPEGSDSLRTALIFDGLGEAFEEDVIGERSIVSKALTQEEAREALKSVWVSLDEPISFESESLYRNFFFGGGNYVRWTGYTVGYNIIKAFHKANSNLSWKELMKTKPEDIFEKSPFVKEIKKEV